MMKCLLNAVCIVLFGLTCLRSAASTTWYVRPDGGTRYSVNITTGQCDGKSDKAYPGKGVNQSCAFKDVRMLWQDGSYTTGTAYPGWGWVGSGGDTYLIRGSLQAGSTYRVGYNNKGSSYCDPTGCWGIAGDPYNSPPAPPSGTSSQHTRILGENYASCRSALAKTQLHGGYGTGVVLNLRGASYIEVACLDITDFSDCGKSAQTHTCNSNVGSLDDYAGAGIAWSNSSTNDTVTDVHIHGLANAGMIGPTGDGVILTYVDMMGNASSGWNADAGDGKTGTGSLLVAHYNISWNGCAEEYPIKHDVPYADCTDDNTGGYGDGFGTATVASSPGWKVTFEQGIVSYNTQDGLDALHLIGLGSSMTVSQTLAYGNMGQQLKVGGASGILRGNIVYTNCNALRQAIPGTQAGYNSRLTDFCRAADTGLVISVNDSSTTIFENNIVYSASATAMEVQASTSCLTSTCVIRQRDNIFIGFRNNKANGYPSGGTGSNSNPVYIEGDINPYSSPNSSFEGNTTYHPSQSWPCPNVHLHEKHATCGSPHLDDETWHVYGTGNTAHTSAALTPEVAEPAEESHIKSSSRTLKVLSISVLISGVWAVMYYLRGRST